MSGFADDARRAFGFLERDFGCRVHASRGARATGHVEYRNGAAFVRVARATAEAGLTVELGPVEGGAAGRPIPLAAVLKARGAPQPPPDDVRAWARALRAHAARALDGDFSELGDLAAPTLDDGPRRRLLARWRRR